MAFVNRWPLFLLFTKPEVAALRCVCVIIILGADARGGQHGVEPVQIMHNSSETYGVLPSTGPRLQIRTDPTSLTLQESINGTTAEVNLSFFCFLFFCDGLWSSSWFEVDGFRSED